MATKSRNTNVIIKIISFILSVVFMTGAFHFVYQIADTGQYYDISLESFDAGSLKDKTLTDTSYLASFFNEDISNLKSELVLKDTENVRAFISKNRDNLHKQFMDSYRQAKEDEWESCEYEDAGFEYKGVFLYLNPDIINENITVSPLEDNEKIAAEKYNAVIDKILESKDFTPYVSEYSRNPVRADLKYLIIDKSNNQNITNLEKGEKESVLDNKYAFTVVNGKITYSPAIDGLFTEYMYDFMSDKNFDIYAFVDESLAQDMTGETYTSYINGAIAAKQRNPKTLAIGAVVSFLLSIAFAIYSLVIAGKRKNGKIKLAWIDYIPTDVHLCLTGAAVGGLIYGVVMIFSESFDYYQGNPLAMKYLYYGVLALIALIWALILEFGTSFIRACKSEKHLYKNTLIYYFIKYIIVKPIAFIIKKIKEFFSFKPDNFKSSIKRAVGLYVIINAGLVIMAFCGMVADFAPVCFVAAFLFFAFNITALIFAVRYIIYLDKIIYAAKTKTVPAVDYNKLPQSLKILVNSIQYTRRELNEAVNKAVRDERLRTELITNVSHDLKTPLTSIITYVDLLKKCDIQDENAKEYIEVLDEKGLRLKRLIEDLIEASKITSGVITLNPVNLSLTELGAQAVYERQAEFADNGLDLVFKGDKGNITAFADGNKTFRIIENLLSNAKKYSAKGSRVYCDVYETQNYSIFEIKNISAQALDITPQELKERFVRGDKSRNNEGNGLGLSIADNLCQAQNGHLNITIDGDLFKAQVMLPKSK